MTRFIVDNPPTAKTVLVNEGLTYVETEIVHAKIAHRPGEIARVALNTRDASWSRISALHFPPPSWISR